MGRFLIEDNKLLEKYNGIWNKVSKEKTWLRKNLVANPSTMKKFLKPKAGLTFMRPQIFTIMKYLK